MGERRLLSHAWRPFLLRFKSQLSDLRNLMSLPLGRTEYSTVVSGVCIIVFLCDFLKLRGEVTESANEHRHLAFRCRLSNLQPCTDFLQRGFVLPFRAVISGGRALEPS